MEQNNQPGQVIQPGNSTNESSDSNQVSGAEASEAKDAGAFVNDAQLPDRDSVLISWTASEYIHHQKSAGWFASMILVVLFISGGIYFITKSIYSSIMVALLGFAFTAFSGRPPRELDYSLSYSGVQIGHKFHEYSEFKSFSVVDEGALSSILLTPLKRFAAPISIYYASNQEEQIVKTLSDYLPIEEAPKDSVGNLMRRLRF